MAFNIKLDIGLGALIEALRKHLDEKNFTDQERAEMELRMQSAATRLEMKELEVSDAIATYELELQKAQAGLIKAEAGGGWLQRNWRPFMMLFFCFLMALSWFGLSAPGITESMQNEVFTLMKIGIGGYIGGRSIEKVAQTLKGGERG